MEENLQHMVHVLVQAIVLWYSNSYSTSLSKTIYTFGFYEYSELLWCLLGKWMGNLKNKSQNSTKHTSYMAILDL